MKLSIIVPVYNERKTLPEVLSALLALSLDKEIVIVDDGSSDGSREFLQGVDSPDVKVVLHDKNYGKGYAIRSALEQVTGEYVIVQDADLEYEPSEIPGMLQLAVEKGADAVYGSRNMMHENKWSYFRYYIGGVLLTWLTNLLYNAGITDEPTCYKLFRSSFLKSLDLRCVGFEFCPEVTAKTRKRGAAILEVPISYRARSMKEGKKIRPRDGLYAAWVLLRERFRKS